jgi:hypothetical protein
MSDNVNLPGTGQNIAAKADPNGVEYQEILNVDKTLTPINPATSDKQDDIVNALKTTEEEIGLTDLLLRAITGEDGVKVQVQLPKDLKQDVSGSLIMSDMIGPFVWSSSTTSNPFILDCTGYDSVFVQR